MATFIFNIEYPAQYRPNATVYALARSTDATISANSSVRADLQAVFAAVAAQSVTLYYATMHHVCRSNAVVTNVTSSNAQLYVDALVALLLTAPDESSQQLLMYIMSALPRSL